MAVRAPKRPTEIPIETMELMAVALRVLAHPVRLKLVELMLIHGEVSVGQLADWVSLAPSATSQHLNTMKVHGIVTSKRDGKTVFYRVVSPDACNVINCIRDHHT